jgi:hypothetical protein
MSESMTKATYLMMKERRKNKVKSKKKREIETEISK